MLELFRQNETGGFSKKNTREFKIVKMTFFVKITIDKGDGGAAAVVSFFQGKMGDLGSLSSLSCSCSFSLKLSCRYFRDLRGRMIALLQAFTSLISSSDT